jgi:hypothetical protein
VTRQACENVDASLRARPSAGLFVGAHGAEDPLESRGPIAGARRRVWCSVRFHPSAGTARGRRWADQQASVLAAIAATHTDRQAQRSLALANPFGERQRCPPGAARAVGVQFVIVCVQAGDVAEVDHAQGWVAGGLVG